MKARNIQLTKEAQASDKLKVNSQRRASTLVNASRGKLLQSASRFNKNRTF